MPPVATPLRCRQIQGSGASLHLASISSARVQNIRCNRIFCNTLVSLLRDLIQSIPIRAQPGGWRTIKNLALWLLDVQNVPCFALTARNLRAVFESRFSAIIHDAVSTAGSV